MAERWRKYQKEKAGKVLETGNTGRNGRFVQFLYGNDRAWGKVPRLETFVHITNALDTTSDEILEGVLNKGYEIRMSEYIKKIEELPKEEQNQIYDVLDVMLKYGHKKK